MLRFRNRFKGTSSDHHTCLGCGRHISRSVQDGRETVIHELPWCERFEAAVQNVAKQEGVEMHAALMAPEIKQTIVFADGETVADIRDVKLDRRDETDPLAS